VTPVTENGLYRDRLPHPGSSYVPSDSRVAPKAEAALPMSSATTARQPIFPSVDFFDTEFQEPTNVFSAPLAVFLDFDEFEGLAPRVPLVVTVEYHGGFCELEHPELGLYGRGETCEEAMVDFLEYLAADYRAYAEEAEENLDSQARALAHRYRTILRRV